MKRRKAIQQLGVLPFAGSLWTHPSNTTFSPGLSTLPGNEYGDSNIFRAIGVEPLINCRGTFTIIGGSLERPEVRAAMEAAAHDFVQYDELSEAVNRRLAEITGAEWAMVSSGCAAGLKHVTAACVTGGNPEKLIRIPNLAGFEKTEVIIPASSRNVYDHALRNIGVRIIQVDSAEELQNVLSKRTAMIYLLADDPAQPNLPLSLENIARMAAAWKIPILVDAAAELLTIPNIHLKRGATVVAYSGGKAICGPQCAGLLLGDKKILQSAWQASSPHHGPGRDNKVGREEMMGMLAAVEAWTHRDHKKEWDTWMSWLESIAKKVSRLEGVTTSIFEPTDLSNHSPVLRVRWDPLRYSITGEEVAEEFGRTKPRIAVGAEGEADWTGITITTGQMQPGNEIVVADRILKFLPLPRNPRSSTLLASQAIIQGRWEVELNFFNSSSQHQWVLEQDGSWIQGYHKGDFSTREIMGTLEGDQLRLRSVDQHPADQL
ncbi:MAG: hypothetical protein ACKO6K_11370, partial [Chitinophagaceae bacterium]